jgi:hypothetical protein
MTKLKNFTLDGVVFRLIGRRDHRGNELYDLEFATPYDRSMTREELRAFAMGMQDDVMWGGMFNTCAGDFTDPTLKMFMAGGEERNDQQEDSA